MVLEIATDSWQVHQGSNTCAAELVSVAESRISGGSGRAECTSADDDLLSRTEDPADWLSSVEGLGGTKTPTARPFR